MKAKTKVHPPKILVADSIAKARELSAMRIGPRLSVVNLISAHPGGNLARDSAPLGKVKKC
jgi:hypothetical protein